ncbi:cell cycle checkpoint control protein Rad9 isoform X1 [Andrena cerasifolii]|uniref:cell cycle checkpoint control protein Rad9 isoform X1 n=2 Tax=Andrena cerasifolii TaxID=2819439 RepID=UPI004037C937
MKCAVPGANVKILAKAIHALARIGDEMYIEPQKSTLLFRTVNMNSSAYADFTFFENYFSYYVYGNLQENDALKCKISMRSAMAVFKATNLIDKQVETCHIRLEPNASEILFILKYKNSITKTHLLPILDCEMLQIAYNKDLASNQFSSQPRVLGDALQNFHQHLIEITLEVSSQKLLLRNYVDDTSGLSNTTRTQVALGRGEFDRYDISSDISITFCMKEFKAILTFAETVGIPASIYFEEAGKPVIFALKNPAFEANLVLSTLNSDADSQTETTLIGTNEKTTKRRVGGKRISKKPSRSISKANKKSATINKTLGNTNSENTHPALTEKMKETNLNSSKEKANSLRDVPSRSLRDDPNKNEVSVLPVERDTREESPNYPSSSRDLTSKLSETSTNRKKIANSVFSSITKRKSSKNETDREQNLDNDNFDAVPNSPPAKKRARLVFQKCFQRTFDPKTLPGYDIILAEDSDECCSE